MNATLDQPVPGSSSASGFTLLELLLVLTIAAMLLVLVPLSFSKGVGQFQGQSSLRDLLTTLAKARSQAINQQRLVEVVLETRTFRLEGREQRRLPGNWRFDFDGVAEEPATESVSQRIRFYPDGSADDRKLILTDGKRAYRIAVQWLTGRARVNVDSEAAPEA